MSVWHTPQATSLISTSPGAGIGQVELLHDERAGELLEHRRAHPHRTFSKMALIPWPPPMHIVSRA